MSRPVSVSTAVYDGYPLDFAIADLAEMGVRLIEPAYIKGYVEFDETAFSAASATRLASMFKANGVGAVGVSAHMDLGLDGARQMLERRIGFVAGIGARYLITNASTRDRKSETLHVIEEVLPALQSLDIVLALENPGHGSNNLLGAGADFASVIAGIGSPHVRANYDIGNCFTYSRETLDPLGDIELVLPHAAHIHAKDVFSDGPDWRFTPLGQGSLDYRRILAFLDEKAPDLPLGIELPLRLDRSGRRDPERTGTIFPLEQIRQAVKSSLHFVTGHSPA